MFMWYVEKLSIIFVVFQSCLGYVILGTDDDSKFSHNHVRSMKMDMGYPLCGGLSGYNPESLTVDHSG
jgi:hypothetical protein